MLFSEFLMRIFIRFIQLIERFFESINQIGLRNAILVFSYLYSRKDRKRYLNFKGKKFFFYPRGDKGVMSHLYIIGYKLKGNPEIIFDVGANIGIESLRFSFFYPNSKIFAIEPSKRNFLLLKDNFKKYKNVNIVNGALWWESKKVFLTQPYPSYESFRIEDGENLKSKKKFSEEVNAYTVNEILDEYKIRNKNIDILKLDIEGSEESLINKGDNSWLKKVNVIIVEMPDNDNPGSFQEIINTLYKMGIKGRSYICGENFIFIKNGADFSLEKVYGLGK